MNSSPPARRRHLAVTLTAAVFATSTLAAIPAAAQAVADPSSQASPGWRPDQPAPDEFDWIRLTSGEWLKGEFVAMYDDSLEFDSEELDLLSLDFADVAEVRTAGLMQVGLVDGTVAVGRLVLQDDTLRILGGDTDRTVTRSQVLSITAGAPREANFWSGKISAGANLRQGNSEQTELNLRAQAQRRTVRQLVGFDYLGNYSVTDGVTAADNQRASLDWKHLVSRHFFVSPTLFEYFRDPFQNVSTRWTLGAGAGATLLDTPAASWMVTVGAAYQHTRLDDVALGVDQSVSTPALLVVTQYDRDITGDIEFSLEYRFFFVNEESGRYTHHFITGVALDLIGSLDLDVTFVWDRIQNPTATSGSVVPKRDDYRLNLAFGFDF